MPQRLPPEDDPEEMDEIERGAVRSTDVPAIGEPVPLSRIRDRFLDEKTVTPPAPAPLFP